MRSNFAFSEGTAVVLGIELIQAAGPPWSGARWESAFLKRLATICAVIKARNARERRKEEVWGEQMHFPQACCCCWPKEIKKNIHKQHIHINWACARQVGSSSQPFNKAYNFKISLVKNDSRMKKLPITSKTNVLFHTQTHTHTGKTVLVKKKKVQKVP